MAEQVHPPAERLSAFALGKLAPAEIDSVESHLAGCDTCCDALRQIEEDTFTGVVRESHQAALAELPTIAPSGTNQPSFAAASGGARQPSTESGLADIPADLANHPRYRIVELLGSGGMGAVYKAEHRLMQRTVALKVINPNLVASKQAVERFRREVQAAARLHHPNIVHAYDAEQAGDVHYLVMEYVKGTDLCKVVEERGPLPVAEACEYIRQAALGLQHAHENGMVHRDIKPQNLMLRHEGREARGEKHAADISSLVPRLSPLVKILDFGLASLTTETPEAHTDQQTAIEEQKSGLTQAGSLMGTPDYMAPEQAKDAHAADIRADIYSLGCTFYYLLTGKVPFPGGTALDKVISHSERKPASIQEARKDVPPALVKVLDRMMAKNPQERFQTPGELGQALASLIDHVHRSAAESRQISPTADWLLVAASLAFLTAIGSLFYWVLAPGAMQMGGYALMFLQVFALENVFYAAIMVAAGQLVRRRRARIVALLCITIVGIAFPLVYAGNIAAEKITVWPLLIPQWLGIPVCVWASIALFRRSSREAFAQAAARSRFGSRNLAWVMGIPAAMLIVGGTIWIHTDGGRLRIECAVDDVQVVVSKGGKEFEVIDLKTGSVVKRLPSGDYEIKLKGDRTDVKLDKTGFTMTRWGQVVVKATHEPSVAAAPREQNLIQGEWKLISVEQNGQVVPPEIWKKLDMPTQFLFQDNLWGAVSPGGQQFSSNFKLYPDKKPIWCDVSGALFDKTMPNLHGILKIEGDTLTVCVVDQKQPRPTEFSSKGARGLMLLVARRVAQSDQDGWAQLFNGKDLTGWQYHPEQSGKWRVEDGILISEGPQSHLFSERGDFKNFHARVEAKINKGGDSGLCFRCAFRFLKHGDPVFVHQPDGYEAQIAYADSEYRTGSLVGRQRVAENWIKPDEWFVLEVIAVGDELTIKVNGKTRAKTDSRYMSQGHFALQHFGPTTKVQFRKIEIKELPGSKDQQPSARRVAELADPGGAYVWSPWVSEDGLTIYGETQRGGGKNWIWTACRKDVLSPFAEKKFLHEGRQPSLRRDGLEMIYTVEGKLVSAHRPELDQPFGPPTELASFNEDKKKQAMPSLTPEGLTLVFQRPGIPLQPWPSTPFYFAQRKTLDAPWQESKPLPIKMPAKFDNRLSWPTLLNNGLTLLCGHEPLGARPAFMVWTRSSVNEPFDQPRYLEGPFPAGRCPRWVAATRELLFFAPATAAEAPTAGWQTGDIWVVKPFDLPSAPAVAKTDEERIQGPWRAVAGEHAGNKLTAEDLKGFKFEFKDDSLKMKLRMGKQSINVEGSFSLDARKDPKKFNLVIQKEQLQKGAKAAAGGGVHGIYRFKGELLELCITEASDPRPTEFATSKKTADQFLLLFERDPDRP